MTARDIQRRLMVERYARSFVLPNYKPKGWFECDVFEITEAGYAVEYEIKLTASDFRADVKKAKERFKIVDGHWTKETQPTKHFQLQNGHAVGPSSFYFVVAAKREGDGVVAIVNESDVPAWAGLIHATEFSRHHAPPWRVSLDIVRRAPKIHGEKCPEEVRKHAESVCYWRMHRLFLYQKLDEADESNKTPPI